MKLLVIVDRENRITKAARAYHGDGERQRGELRANFTIVPGENEQLFELEVPDELIARLSARDLHVNWRVDTASDTPRLVEVGESKEILMDQGDDRVPDRQAKDENQPGPPNETLKRGDPPKQDDYPKIYGPDYESALRPIVFVPGFLGSRLRRKTDGQYVWPPIIVNPQGHFQIIENFQQLSRPASER